MRRGLDWFCGTHLEGDKDEELLNWGPEPTRSGTTLTRSLPIGKFAKWSRMVPTIPKERRTKNK
jgi:hypothetical protein